MYILRSNYMGKLIFENNNEEAQIPDGEAIKESCEQAGIPFCLL